MLQRRLNVLGDPKKIDCLLSARVYPLIYYG